VDSKLEAQEHLNAVLPGQLLHLQDNISKWLFLVDTGAAYSVFPHHSSEVPTGLILCGPGSQPIACWGEKTKSISIAFGGHCLDISFGGCEVSNFGGRLSAPPQPDSAPGCRSVDLDHNILTICLSFICSLGVASLCAGYPRALLQPLLRVPGCCRFFRYVTTCKTLGRTAD
jgi:hypothetical protein